MTYVATSLIVVWVCGILFFAGQQLNDMRVIYNNFVPGAQAKSAQSSQTGWPRRVLAFVPFDPPGLLLGLLGLLLDRAFRHERFDGYRAFSIDPELLTETGRAQLRKSIRHGWIMLAWVVGGFVLIACYFSFIRSS